MQGTTNVVYADAIRSTRCVHGYFSHFNCTPLLSEEALCLKVYVAMKLLSSQQADMIAQLYDLKMEN